MSHLNYVQRPSVTGKTKVVTISSMFDGTILGEVRWYGRWRQYVFIPATDCETVWSWDCLHELEEYIVKLNTEQRKK